MEAKSFGQYLSLEENDASSQVKLKEGNFYPWQSQPGKIQLKRNDNHQYCQLITRLT